MADFHIDTLAIIGVGLMGGSLALALREKGAVDRVIGVGRTAPNLERARARGIIDDFTHDPAEAVAGADIVVLATPVESFAGLMDACASRFTPGCIITDVGSTKQAVIDAIESRLPEGVSFVPSHPIAGTEQTGADAAMAELYRGAICILTPTQRTPDVSLATIRAMWHTIGMEVVDMPPDIHDRTLGAVSHVPHLVAYALVLSVLDMAAPGGAVDPVKLSGGGFRDFTRIAASSPDMWRDICAQNAPAILDSLDAFDAALAQIRRLIESGDWEKLHKEFERARAVRSRMRASESPATS